MKKGAGKVKGGEFERGICKLLSLYVTHGKRDDVFWRSAMSGGRATVSHRKGHAIEHVSGDICAVHADGFDFIRRYYVECKFVADLNYPGLLTRGAGPIVKFWEAARFQARENGKRPILIMKQNLFPIMVGADCNYPPPFEHILASATLPYLGMELYPLHDCLTRQQDIPRRRINK